MDTQLRWVVRDGVKVLQMTVRQWINDVEEFVWVDVPIEELP